MMHVGRLAQAMALAALIVFSRREAQADQRGREVAAQEGAPDAAGNSVSPISFEEDVRPEPPHEAGHPIAFAGINLSALTELLDDVVKRVAAAKTDDQLSWAVTAVLFDAELAERARAIVGDPQPSEADLLSVSRMLEAEVADNDEGRVVQTVLLLVRLSQLIPVEESDGGHLAAPGGNWPDFLYDDTRERWLQEVMFEAIAGYLSLLVHLEGRAGETNMFLARAASGIRGLVATTMGLLEEDGVQVPPELLEEAASLGIQALDAHGASEREAQQDAVIRDALG